jgi:hypothetical protein
MSPVASPAEGKSHDAGVSALGSLREKGLAEPAYSHPQPAVHLTPKPASPVPAPLFPSLSPPQPSSIAEVHAMHAVYGNAAMTRALVSGEIAPTPEVTASAPMAMTSPLKSIAAIAAPPSAIVAATPASPPPAVAPMPKPAVAPPTPPAPSRFASPTAGPPTTLAKPAAVVETKQTVSPTGHAIPRHVKDAIENSFSIDMDGVEVHADDSAQSAAGALSARAFAYGNHIFLGKNEKLTDIRLIAHEAAHVVQQKGVPTVMRSAPGQSDVYESEADRAASAVERGEKFTVQERVTQPRVQRSIVSRVRNWVAEKAYNIPGFRLLSILIGHNPINWEVEERSAANVLRGLVELLPVVGHQIEEALNKYGVFEKAGAWFEKQFEKMKAVGRAIVKDWEDFVDGLSWTDIRHPIKVIEDGLDVFRNAIVRIADFIKGVVVDILELIKQAILMPLAKLAEGTRGWDLLIAVLGKNPITGEPVERSAENLIGGFMKLIHQEEVWQNIKKANAISRAWAWFQGAIKGLIGFVIEIPHVFIQALKSLTLEDILILPKAFIKVGKVFGNFILKFLSWAGETVWTLLQIIFEVLAPGAMPYLKKVGAAFRSILKNPIGFVGNLVRAGKLGFQMFVDNIGEHLKTSFIEWLTGNLPGVYIPKALEFREILKFVLSVLGLTWQNIRKKLVKVVGETAVKAMEVGFDIVVTLVTEGPAAAWDKIQDMLSNLKDMVLQGIMDFIIETVVKKAVAKILSMLVPGGAFIQAIISIYDTIKVFIEKLAKIIQVAKAFLDSIVEIASGAIAGAAKKVESTLAGLLTLAISFLAGFLGLGGIAAKVMEIINTKVRDPIDKALDKVIDWIVMMAKKLFGKKEKPDDRTEEQKKADLDKGIAEAESLQKTPDITDLDIKKGLVSIKAKYKMTSLELVVDSEDESKETVHVEGEINPKGSSKPQVIGKSGKIQGLRIERPSDFTANTAKELLKEAAKILGTDPAKVNYVAAGLARRHVVSSKDMADHYQSNLNEHTFADAKNKLDPKLKLHGIPPVTLTGKQQIDAETILDRAKVLHAKFFSDLDNLFVGEARENSSIGRALDPKHPEIGLEGLEDHIAEMKNRYAINGLVTTPVKD